MDNDEIYNEVIPEEGNAQDFHNYEQNEPIAAKTILTSPFEVKIFSPKAVFINNTEHRDKFNPTETMVL